MSKLIVVSNRVPAPGATAEAGGLAVAIQHMLTDRGGAWLGWSGGVSETPEIHERLENRTHYRTMDLTKEEYEGFYVGFCNSILWPLCHYRMDLGQFKPEMYDVYESVNCKFADQVMSVANRGDQVWAHDYHLISLGKHLRARGAKQRLGFFLHIPFPAPEVFCALPHHAEFMEALSAYDILGFQTDTDLQAFLRCMTDVFRVPVIVQVHKNMYEVTAFGRTFRAGKFAIGIDTQDMMVTAERSDQDAKAIRLRKNCADRPMVIGVDRMDYTKGLIERVNAFDRLLTKYSDYRGNVSYVQITPPSRTDVKDYQNLRDELERTAARVNGTHAEIDWSPIHYMSQSFTRSELAGFYRAARVGLVTPLRDGMNLVAKEYVAAQDPVNPGVLVLSKFAGAADELKVGALITNPYDAEETAELIHKALTMPLAERKKRYEAMMVVLKHDDIFLWSKRFLSCLKGDSVKPVVPAIAGDHANAFTMQLGKIGNYIPSLSELIKNLSMTG